MTLFLVVSSLACGFGCGWAAGRKRKIIELRLEIVRQMERDRLAALQAGIPTLRPRIRSSIRSPRDATGPAPRPES